MNYLFAFSLSFARHIKVFFRPNGMVGKIFALMVSLYFVFKLKFILMQN